MQTYYLTQQLEIVDYAIENWMTSGTLEEMEVSQAVWTKVRDYQKPKRETGIMTVVRSDDAAKKQAEWLSDKKQWVEARTRVRGDLKTNGGKELQYGMATLIKTGDGSLHIFTENHNRTILIQAQWSDGKFCLVRLVDKSSTTEATTRLKIEALPCYAELFKLWQVSQRLIG